MIAVYATSADPCAFSAMTPQLGMYGHEKHKETHVMSGVAMAPIGARESRAEARGPFAPVMAMALELGTNGHKKHKKTHVMSGVAIAPMGARESGAEAAVPFAFFVAMAPETGTKGQAKATMPDVRRRQRNP